MADPGPDDLRNVLILLFVVTFLVTSYRCFSRYSKRLWWHDDSMALFSTLSLIVFLVGAVHLADRTTTQEERIVNSYVLIIGFYLPTWSARISIVLTLVRITPWKRQRKILLWIVAFFVLQFIMLTAETFWICRSTQSVWEHLPGSICVVTRIVPISLVVTTVVSDVILVTAPLMIVKGVHIAALRFRLLSIFSMSIATTLASLVHAVLVMVKQGIWEAIFGAVGAAVSIIVCNMSVIIPALLRALGVGDPFMQEDTVDPGFSTDVEIVRMASTRVELGLPTSRGTALTDSDESQGTIGTVASRRDPIVLGVKDERKRQLSTKASDGSLGGLKRTKVVPLVDESDIADSLAQVRSLPTVKTDQEIESDARGRHVKNNST